MTDTEETLDTDDILEAFVHMAFREAENTEEYWHIKFEYEAVREEAEAQFGRWLAVRDANLKSTLTELVSAGDQMHRTYGSTATCHGGVGGAAMTPHCAHVCHNTSAHEAEQARWDAAYKAAREMLADE